MNDKIKISDSSDATVKYVSGVPEGMRIQGYFDAKYYGPDGKLEWCEQFPNLVTTVGKNHILDTVLKGAAYTQTVRMGLKGTGSAASADTQASHAGWLEVGLANAPTYSGSRPSITMGSAAAGVSTAPAQVFNMTSAGTVSGCFINNGGSATIDNTTGTLISAGDFSSGDKPVSSGGTLTVTYSLTLS